MMAGVNRGRNWSELIPDLLDLIAGTLTEISDLYRFRAVCKSWRSACRPLPRGGPWLLFLPDIDSPDQEEEDIDSPDQEEEDIDSPDQEEEDCHIIIPSHKWRRFTLPNPYSILMKSNYVYGSPYGYFLVIDKTTGSVFIGNPLITRKWFALPTPVPNIPETEGCYDLSAAKIFKSVNSRLTVVVSVVVSSGEGYTPFLWRIGDSDWTQMCDDDDNVAGGNVALDVVLYKGSFYLTEIDEHTIVLDSTTLTETCQIENPDVRYDKDKNMERLLVESSSGELLMVWWDLCYCIWVFQLDLSEEESPKWVRVRNIGGDTLFLREEGLLCFPTGRYGGFRKNCVYFIPPNEEKHQVTIMNIEDDKWEVLPHVIGGQQRPIWIIPRSK